MGNHFVSLYQLLSCDISLNMSTCQNITTRRKGFFIISVKKEGMSKFENYLIVFGYQFGL